MAQSKITGAISLMTAQAIVLVLGYATHLWIGRVLGPASYGIYGVVLSIQSIIGLLLNLGVPMAISRFVAQDKEHARSILRQALKIQILLALVIAGFTAISAPAVAKLLGDQNLVKFIRFVAIVLFIQAGYPIFVQYLSGMHKFNRQAALTAIYAIAKLAGALSLIYFLGVYGAFAGFAIGGLVAAGVGFYWTKGVGGRLPLKLSMKDFLGFAGTYVMILFGLQLLISLDLFMVKAILKDNNQTGYYNAAVTLARISFMLLQSLTFILLPSVSALTKPGQSQMEAVKFIKDTLRYLIGMIVPSVVIAAVTSRSLILLFYSNQYIEAASALTVLMIGLGALGFYLLLVNIVAGAGKANVGLGITVLLLFISSAVGYWLIPRMGIMGAAWQTTVAGLIGLVILAIYTLKTFKVEIPVRSVINILIASAVAVLPTYVWEVNPWLLPMQYIVLFGTYILVLILLGEVTRDDRIRLSRLHPRLGWVAKRRS